MAHIHSVYDTDSHFSINPVTRAIKNESSKKNLLIQHDHNSERFTFEIPRHIEEHDMSEVTKAEIHYVNIDAATKAQSTGLYEVDDLQLSPADENIVICSWLISGNATKYVGTLNFIVRFVCLTGSTIDYAWHSGVCSGVSVGTGIYNSEAIAEEYADILAKWSTEIDLLKAADNELFVKANEALNKSNACLNQIHEHENKSIIDTISSDNIASWNSAANSATRANDRLDSLAPMVTANETDITALKASVSNLQDEDVSISATATQALNKANSALDNIKRIEAESAHAHENKSVLDTITSDNVAAWNAAANKATQNRESLDALRPIVTANQTDITALKASVSNLQDEDVEIGKNIAAVNATATKANNKADVLLSDAAVTVATMGMQKKNLLKNTASTVTTNGVTFTVNDDGSVTANGTATDTAFFNIPYNHTGESKSVILSGCPANGSGETYMFRADNAGTVVARDYGNGVTISPDVLATITYVAIRIQSGYTADNLTFYPMIRYADITDSTYEQYTPSLQEQIDELRSQIAAMTAVTTETEE
ncbi:MAG: hypothetical protein IJY74_06225 [Oscillospiraceae bacterium]|nr:hypothetical protein [Oscillospiraceae bacterium]